MPLSDGNSNLARGAKSSYLSQLRGPKFASCIHKIIVSYEGEVAGEEERGPNCRQGGELNHTGEWWSEQLVETLISERTRPEPKAYAKALYLVPQKFSRRSASRNLRLRSVHFTSTKKPTLQPSGRPPA